MCVEVENAVLPIPSPTKEWVMNRPKETFAILLLLRGKTMRLSFDIMEHFANGQSPRETSL